MRDDLPDQTHRLCSVGIDAIPREQQLHRIGPADALREAYRCHDRRDSELHLWKTELGPVTRQYEIGTRWQV